MVTDYPRTAAASAAMQQLEALGEPVMEAEEGSRSHQEAAGDLEAPLDAALEPVELIEGEEK